MIETPASLGGWFFGAAGNLGSPSPLLIQIETRERAFMNSRTNVLGQAIRYALVAGTAGLVAAPAFAQETPNTTNLDRIEITGSRIRQVDVETAQPVFAISRTDIAPTR
jgi:hypothetical protein